MLRHPVGFVRVHRSLRAQSSAYLDGDLDAAAAQRISEHARVCPPCHRLLESLRAVLTGLLDLREPAPRSTGVADRAIERLRAEPGPR